MRKLYTQCTDLLAYYIKEVLADKISMYISICVVIYLLWLNATNITSELIYKQI